MSNSQGIKKKTPHLRGPKLLLKEYFKLNDFLFSILVKLIQFAKFSYNYAMKAFMALSENKLISFHLERKMLVQEAAVRLRLAAEINHLSLGKNKFPVLIANFAFTKSYLPFLAYLVKLIKFFNFFHFWQAKLRPKCSRIHRGHQYKNCFFHDGEMS